MDELLGTISPIGYIFAALALIGALLAVSLRNILHAIFALALCLFGLAGLFLLLGSPFVAAMEVLIYVGGISVAMAFAVMFAYSIGDATRKVRLRRVFAAGAAALGVAGLIGQRLLSTSFAPAPAGRDGSVAALGRALLTHYNLVFEVLSVVLLLAIVGAIIVARHEVGSRDSHAGADHR